MGRACPQEASRRAHVGARYPAPWPRRGGSWQVGLGPPIEGTEQVWTIDGGRGVVADRWVGRACPQEASRRASVVGRYPAPWPRRSGSWQVGLGPPIEGTEQGWTIDGGRGVVADRWVWRACPQEASRRAYVDARYPAPWHRRGGSWQVGLGPPLEGTEQGW